MGTGGNAYPFKSGVHNQLTVAAVGNTIIDDQTQHHFFAGRGDKISHFRKIIYYGVVQNAAFHMLQKAAFAVLFNDEGIEDEEEEKRLWSVLNGMADTMLAGSGFAGMGMAMMKNVTLELIDEFSSDKPADTREALVNQLHFHLQ